MKKIIIANHKMNLNFLEMKKYIEILNKYKDKFIVCPSNIYIPYFVSENFKVGIQNIYKGIMDLILAKYPHVKPKALE